MWWGLSWQAIRSQYRRTYLGPWWITVQQVIFVAGLSLLFGILMGQDLKTFIPYVAIGFIAFNWMTAMLGGGATCITLNSPSIKTSTGPLSTYALSNFASATIQFAHNAVVIVFVVVVFQGYVSWTIVVLPLALIVVAVNGIAIGLWLGPVVARYRDDYATAESRGQEALAIFSEVGDRWGIGHTLANLGMVAWVQGRSEERRVGKECRSRWSPYH